MRVQHFLKPHAAEEGKCASEAGCIDEVERINRSWSVSTTEVMGPVGSPVLWKHLGLEIWLNESVSFHTDALRRHLSSVLLLPLRLPLNVPLHIPGRWAPILVSTWLPHVLALFPKWLCSENFGFLGPCHAYCHVVLLPCLLFWLLNHSPFPAVQKQHILFLVGIHSLQMLLVDLQGMHAPPTYTLLTNSFCLHLLKVMDWRSVTSSLLISLEIHKIMSPQQKKVGSERWEKQAAPQWESSTLLLSVGLPSDGTGQSTRVISRASKM